MTCIGCLRKVNRFLKENWLSIAMVLAIISGLAIGVILKRYVELTQRQVIYIGYLGHLFLQGIQGVCIPLMVGCIIVSFADLDTALMKFYGLRLVLFIIITKFIGLAIGLSVTLAFKPGVITKRKMENASSEVLRLNVVSDPIDSFLNIFYNLFPSNLIGMNFKITYANKTKDFEGKDKLEIAVDNGVNMLGLATFSIATGIAFKIMGKNSKSLLTLTTIITEICKFIVVLLMLISPVLLMSLVAGQMVQIELEVFATAVGKYTACAIGTLMTMFLVIFPVIIVVMSRSNPLILYWRYMTVITTGFACDSALATLPIAMRVLVEEMHYNEDLVSFVVPILLAINKDAGPILLPTAVIYFAQYEDVKLDWHAYIVLCIFSLILTMAAPGVPQAMLVVIMLVLDNFDIPKGNIGSIIAVDVLIDRLSTVVHVTACLVAVSMLSKHTLPGENVSSFKSSRTSV